MDGLPGQCPGYCHVQLGYVGLASQVIRRVPAGIGLFPWRRVAIVHSFQLFAISAACAMSDASPVGESGARVIEPVYPDVRGANTPVFCARKLGFDEAGVLLFLIENSGPEIAIAAKAQWHDPEVLRKTHPSASILKSRRVSTNRFGAMSGRC